MLERKAGRIPGLPDTHGEPLNDGNLRKRMLQPADRKMGLPGLGWHTLRRTHATLLQAAGGSLNSRDISSAVRPASYCFSPAIVLTASIVCAMLIFPLVALASS